MFQILIADDDSGPDNYCHLLFTGRALHTFGSGESWERRMNLTVGSGTCMLTVAMGIYMICRANREIKKQQEIIRG